MGKVVCKFNSSRLQIYHVRDVGLTLLFPRPTQALLTRPQQAPPRTAILRLPTISPLRRPTSLDHTSVGLARDPLLDWSISKDMSARIPKRSHSSVLNVLDASHAEICYCGTSRSCTCRRPLLQDQETAGKVLPVAPRQDPEACGRDLLPAGMEFIP